jgi:transposase-like protein DUF772
MHSACGSIRACRWTPSGAVQGPAAGHPTWHDLPDIRLAEALGDCASFRRFCGFVSREPTPGRTAFVRFRRELVARGLVDRVPFDAVTGQLDAKAWRCVPAPGGRDPDPLGEHPRRRRGPLGRASPAQARARPQGARRH